MTAAIWIVAVLLIGILITVAMNMVHEEVQTRLLRLPMWLLRRAARRLPEDSREEDHLEWQSWVLTEIDEAHDKMPVTRLVLGLRHAVPLWWSAQPLRPANLAEWYFRLLDAVDRALVQGGAKIVASRPSRLDAVVASAIVVRLWLRSGGILWGVFVALGVALFLELRTPGEVAWSQAGLYAGLAMAVHALAVVWLVKRGVGKIWKCAMKSTPRLIVAMVVVEVLMGIGAIGLPWVEPDATPGGWILCGGMAAKTLAELLYVSVKMRPQQRCLSGVGPTS